MARTGEVNHYATGLTLITVGAFGVIGSLTGELGNMLAALWAPDALTTSTGAAIGPNQTAGIPGVPGWLSGLGNAVSNFFGGNPLGNL